MSDYCATIQTIVCSGRMCSGKMCSEDESNDNVCDDSIECEELKGSVPDDLCEQTASVSGVMVKTLFANNKVQLLVNDQGMAVLI